MSQKVKDLEKLPIGSIQVFGDFVIQITELDVSCHKDCVFYGDDGCLFFDCGFKYPKIISK